jgi:hypothetical protein
MNLFGSHSSTVEMWIECAYGIVPLARITPKSVVARERHDIPPCEADLIVAVDGHRIRNRVMLTSGFSRGRLAALVRPVNDSAPF